MNQISLQLKPGLGITTKKPRGNKKNGIYTILGVNEKSPLNELVTKIEHMKRYS